MLPFDVAAASSVTRRERVATALSTGQDKSPNGTYGERLVSLMTELIEAVKVLQHCVPAVQPITEDSVEQALTLPRGQVQIQELQSATGTQLNEMAGTAMYFDRSSARYCVRMHHADQQRDWKKQ